jgi:hypothetical protein
MAVYGLTTEGFVTKTLDTLREDLEAALRAAFSASLRLGDKSIFGQIVGIWAERLSLLWELSEAINASQDPDKATGAALEALCLLTGTTRPPATYSAVTLTLCGDDGTIVPSGSQVSTDSTSVVFATTASATITLLTAWVTLTAYAVGDRRSNGGYCYECVTAGTSSSGPASPNPEDPGQDLDLLVDGTAYWSYLGEGEGAIDVTAAATETGPVAAYSRDITTIVNNVAGWTSVVNLLDANEGRAIATDGELRLLREQELASGGNTTINALRSELLQVPEVVSAMIFVNNTDVTDADLIPPHSVEALVRGPATPSAAYDQSIFDTLLDGVAAGIRTYGQVSGWSTDSQGTSHLMKFTRPTEVPIYVILTIITDAAYYPIDGDDLVAQAIVDWGDLQVEGKNAVASRIGAQAFTVPGVIDVVTCFIDDAPAPAAETTVAISLRQIATYDTSRITVNSSTGTP